MESKLINDSMIEIHKKAYKGLLKISFYIFCICLMPLIINCQLAVLCVKCFSGLILGTLGLAYVEYKDMKFLSMS